MSPKRNIILRRLSTRQLPRRERHRQLGGIVATRKLYDNTGRAGFETYDIADVRRVTEEKSACGDIMTLTTAMQ